MQAYCPAFDFNPLETDMTFEEIVAILKDHTRTEYQRAADIHAALTKASQPSAFNIKPKTERKKREARKAIQANIHVDDLYRPTHEEATP